VPFPFSRSEDVSIIGPSLGRSVHRCCTVGRAGVRHYSRIDKNCGPQDVHVGLVTSEVISKRQCTQRVFLASRAPYNSSCTSTRILLRCKPTSPRPCVSAISVVTGKRWSHKHLHAVCGSSIKTHNVGAVRNDLMEFRSLDFISWFFQVWHLRSCPCIQLQTTHSSWHFCASQGAEPIKGVNVNTHRVPRLLHTNDQRIDVTERFPPDLFMFIFVVVDLASIKMSEISTHKATSNSMLLYEFGEGWTVEVSYVPSPRMSRSRLSMDMLCPGSANIVIKTHMLMPGVIVEQVMYVVEERQGEVREL
jgi:hypothetical protein